MRIILNLEHGVINVDLGYFDRAEVVNRRSLRIHRCDTMTDTGYVEADYDLKGIKNIEFKLK